MEQVQKVFRVPGANGLLLDVSAEIAAGILACSDSAHAGSGNAVRSGYQLGGNSIVTCLDGPALLKMLHCPALVLLLACCGESVLLVTGRPKAMLLR